MPFRLSLFICLLFIASSNEDVNAGSLANSTSKVINALLELGQSANKRFANTSGIDHELDKIGKSEEDAFDVSLYSEKVHRFKELAKNATAEAKCVLHKTNPNRTQESMDASEAALKNMTKVSNELHVLESGLRDKLQSALAAKLNPELLVADEVEKNTSFLQHKAHSMMDPLYSIGDAAQDQADRMNDQINDAQSLIDKAVRIFRRHLIHHSREVQRGVERNLFSGGPDRTAERLRVSRLVAKASKLTKGSRLQLPSLDSLGGLTLLVTAVTTGTAVGALMGLILHSVVKAKGTHYEYYERLNV